MRSIWNLSKVTFYEALREGVCWAPLIAISGAWLLRALLAVPGEPVFAQIEMDFVSLGLTLFLWVVALLAPALLWDSEFRRDTFAMCFARGVRPWQFFLGKYFGLLASCSLAWCAFWLLRHGAADTSRVFLKFFLFLHVGTALSCALSRGWAVLAAVAVFGLGHLQTLFKLSALHGDSLWLKGFRTVWSTVGPHFEFFEASGGSALPLRHLAGYVMLYCAGCFLAAAWFFSNRMMRTPCGSAR